MSIFDKFYNAKDKLQPAVEPEDTNAVPGGNGVKILSDTIAQKLAQRHQQMMSAMREKQQQQVPDKDTSTVQEQQPQKQEKDEDAAAATLEEGMNDDDNNTNNNNNNSDKQIQDKDIDAGDNDEEVKSDDDDDDDDVPEDEEGTSIFATAVSKSEDTMFASPSSTGDNSSSTWNKKGDASSDFLVFGGAKASALKGATNTSKAVEMSEADHYMARVSGFTFVQKQQEDQQEETKYFKTNQLDRHSTPAEMITVDTQVPLWAAHRFTPRSMLVKEEPISTTATNDAEQNQNSIILKDTPLKKQLLSTNPANKREAAAVRTYLNGYSPIDCIALHQEILDFYDWIRPTEAELVLRTMIEKQVKNIASALFPGCEPVVYGSQTTGLLLPWSDLDMSVLNVTNSTVEDGLLSLSKQITLNGMCEGHAPQVILKTKVPLIKFQSSIAPIDVDVSINAGDGKQNSEWVSKSLAKFPESKYLIILVKYFLHQRDLNEPYRGGVGSFAATLIVLSFLQHHPIYTTDCPNRSSYGLGRLFVDFLQYYGSLGFSPERIGISVRNPSSAAMNNENSQHDILAQNGGCCYYQRDSPAAYKCRPVGPKGPTKLDIEDPVTLDNNAASSVRLIQMVQSSFEGAFLLLTARAPALNSLLAPAHLFPDRSQLYQPPKLFSSASSGEFERMFGSMNPVNDHVTRRPTLLSRIIHHDVDLVAKRIATQETFDRFKRDQLSKEAQLFHEILKMIPKTKGYQTQVEIKTRSRYDADAEEKKNFRPQVVPHSPFALGYNQDLHEQYFKNKVGEIVKDHKNSLGALAKTQIGDHQKQHHQQHHQKLQSSSYQSSQNQQSQQSQKSNSSSNSRGHQQQRRQRDDYDDDQQHQRGRPQNDASTSNKRNKQKQKQQQESDDDDDHNYGAWQNAF